MSKNMILILYENFNFVLSCYISETNICYRNSDFRRCVTMTMLDYTRLCDVSMGTNIRGNFGPRKFPWVLLSIRNTCTRVITMQHRRKWDQMQRVCITDAHANATSQQEALVRGYLGSLSMLLNRYRTTILNFPMTLLNYLHCCLKKNSCLTTLTPSAINT